MMNSFQKMLGSVVFLSIATACGPLTVQGGFGQNTFDTPTDGGLDPTGSESEEVVQTIFGQLSGGRSRVSIPLEVLGVTAEELEVVNVEIVSQNEATRAYDLDPVVLNDDASDVIIFVVSLLEDGDLLTVTIDLPDSLITFSAPVSADADVAVDPS